MIENERLPETPVQAASIEPAARESISGAALSVVLVAHDQAAEAEAIVIWVQYLASLAREHEIIVTDGTSAGISVTDELFTTEGAELHLLRSENTGFGPALKAGLDHARFPLVCYTVCSRQYDPADLSSLLKWIDQTDLVGGYRTIQSRPYRLPLAERLLWWLSRILFAVRLRDVGCFFLLARRAIFDRIPIQSNGPFAHVEILAKTNFLGCIMSEAPVTFQPRHGGNSTETLDFKHSLRELSRLFRRPDFGPPRLPGSAWPRLAPLEREAEPRVQSVPRRSQVGPGNES